MSKDCLIVGGGIAGLRAAYDLVSIGVQVTLVNSSKELGGNLRNFQACYSGNLTTNEILQKYVKDLESNPRATILKNTRVVKVLRSNYPFELELNKHGTISKIKTGSVILSTGFEPINPSLLGEYGHGKLSGVISSIEFENAAKEGNLPINEHTRRIVFVLCVGSRTSHVNPDCSAYCCSLSIKQALHVVKNYPSIEPVILYMDVRTLAEDELLFSKARKSGVIFIRGRPASIERTKEKLYVNFENTFKQQNDILPADVVVLAMGGMPSPSSNNLVKGLGVQVTENNFIKITKKPVNTSTPGVFCCGSAGEGVKTIRQSLSEGGAAAMAVYEFLSEVNV